MLNGMADSRESSSLSVTNDEQFLR